MRTFEKLIYLETKRENLRIKGCKFVHELLNTYPDKNSETQTPTAAPAQPPLVPKSLCTAFGNALNYIVHAGLSTAKGEIACYLSNPASQKCIGPLGNENLYILRYWAHCTPFFPKLSQAQLCFLAVLSSSCKSE